MRIIAETDRLILRGEREGDFATWLAHMNVPDVMARLGGPQREEAVTESFARMRAQEQDVPGFWFVARKVDDVLIGKCGTSLIETPHAPELLQGALQIGWTLRADCWGRGYAAEAANALLVMAFGSYGAQRIYGQTSLSNAASWRLMQRLGMTRRAELDYPDPDYPPDDNPTMVWELARAEWQECRADA